MPIYLECLKPSWKYVVLDFFVILLDAIFEIMIPYLCGLLIRQGLQPLNMNAVWLYGGLMIGMALLAILFQAIGMKLSAIISSDYIERLRNTIFLESRAVFVFEHRAFSCQQDDDDAVQRLQQHPVFRPDARANGVQTDDSRRCLLRFYFFLNWAIGLITLPLSLIAFFCHLLDYSQDPPAIHHDPNGFG